MYVQDSCYLFDVLVQTDDSVWRELKRLLEDEDLIKVMHDCRKASAALFNDLGIRLNNVFDTQVSTCMHSLAC